MPTIENSVTVNAPLERVYSIAKDSERFPQFMPEVKELTVVERDAGRVVTQWVGVVPKFNVPIRWTEEDIWDDVEHTCTFRQLKGDFDRMSGVWSFVETPDGTTWSSVVEYEYNVPIVGALIQKVVKHLMTLNVQGLMDALKRHAESA